MFCFSASLFLCCWLIAKVHCDFFERHVKKFLNDSVRPCDDFYRHVCTTKMQHNDYAVQYGNYLEQKWLKEMEGEHWKQSPPTAAEILIRAMRTNPLVYVQIHDLKHKFPGLYNYFKMLMMAREKMHILKHPERKSILLGDQLMIEMFSLAREQIEQSTDRFGKEQIEEFTRTLEILVYSVSRYDEPEHFNNTVMAFDRLLKKDQELPEMNEYTISTEFYWFLEAFKKYEDVLFSAIQWNTDGLSAALYGDSSWSASTYPGKHIRFSDPVLAVTVNTSIPTLYGYFALVAGHELFHTYQTRWNFEDEALGKSARCIASHMNKTCHTFSEGIRCLSGRHTFDGDGPDMEGMQMAYKLFTKRIGDDLKSEFSDTGFSNQQMFFYSVSTTFCAHNPSNFIAKKPDGSDDFTNHSAWFVRSNGNLSLMKAFHEAFQCKPGDRMYDIAEGTEECNTFGDPVRK